MRVNPYIPGMNSPDPSTCSVHRDIAASTLDPYAQARRKRDAGNVVVPIRSLGQRHRDLVLMHLLALEPTDRYLRFGYHASNEHISSYVRGLDMYRDELFGIFNRKLELIAFAHLAFPKLISDRLSAEFGVSVATSARGRGYGARLFERACMHARNEGYGEIKIHALTENSAMLRIARSAGAAIVRDGPDAEAHLRLPPATLESRFSEIVQEQWALADYRYKEHGKHLRDMLIQWRAPTLDAQLPTMPSSSVKEHPDL